MTLSAYKLPTRILRAIGSESGLMIFFLLSRRREMCVTDIARAVKLSISATSHQLKKMESAGLIDSERHGRVVCYLFTKHKVARELARCLQNATVKGRRN